jgi:MATE family multidrug resistance protein
MTPLAAPFFALVGHEAAVQQHEVAYGGILMRGALPAVLMATLSTFFAGRGQTKPILLVNVLATLVNVFLDYAWIFGHWGFPAGGSSGAAWATVSSQAVGCAAYLAMIWAPASRRAYRTLSGWRFDPALLRRLLRFGLPTGFQFAIEVSAFALFLMIVGRISTAALAASGIAFNLNMLAFMPMVGLAIGVSSLVGRYLGADRPDLAERATWSAFQLGFAYMVACGLAYVLVPGLLLAPYRAGSTSAGFAEVEAIAAVLLRFVAFYATFDTANLIFSGCLKGAGDTAYPMKTTTVLAWAVMLGPAYIGCVLLPGGVYVAWSTATAYVLLLGLMMFRRFRAGGWKGLRVIEPSASSASPPA